MDSAPIKFEPMEGDINHVGYLAFVFTKCLFQMLLRLDCKLKSGRISFLKSSPYIRGRTLHHSVNILFSPLNVRDGWPSTALSRSARASKNPIYALPISLSGNVDKNKT